MPPPTPTLGSSPNPAPTRQARAILKAGGQAKSRCLLFWTWPQHVYMLINNLRHPRSFQRIFTCNSSFKSILVINESKLSLNTKQHLVLTPFSKMTFYGVQQWNSQKRRSRSLTPYLNHNGLSWKEATPSKQYQQTPQRFDFSMCFFSKWSHAVSLLILSSWLGQENLRIR